MTKTYICSADNIKFSSKEELINHMLEKYCLEDDENGELSRIRNGLIKAFPFADVFVRETDKEETEAYYGEYYVNMKWNDYYGDFYFYIGNYSSTDYESNSFINLHQAIENYKVFERLIESISNKLDKAYSPSKIDVTDVEERNDYSPDTIGFSIYVDGLKYYATYELGVDEDSFVKSFEGYFKSTVEGNIIKCHDHDSIHRDTVFIGDIPLQLILDRAKTIRIEILQENE